MKHRLLSIPIILPALLAGAGYTNAADDIVEARRVIELCGLPLNCPDGFEADQIGRFAGVAKRDGQGVSLALLQNEPVTLQFENRTRDAEGYRKFTFISYFENAGYYLLHLQQYEGGPVYVYINNRDGAIEYVNSFRHFSPGGRYYAAAHIDIDNEFPDNWLRIVSIRNHEQAPELSVVYKPQSTNGMLTLTGPVNLRWVDENRIAYEEISLTTGAAAYAKHEAHLQRRDGQWHYQGQVPKNALEIKHGN